MELSKIIFPFICSLLLSIAPTGRRDLQLVCAESGEDWYLPNRIVVTLKNEVSKELREYDTKDFPELSLEKVTDLTSPCREAFLARGKNEPTDFGDGLSLNKYNQALLLHLKPGVYSDPFQAMKLLEAREEFLCVSPDCKPTIQSVTPNDPLYSSQWGPANINLPAAWAISTGSSRVSVGILDTGMQGNHPDLTANVDTNLSASFLNGNVTNVGTPSDSNSEGHGTRVAGIIGAEGQNGIGVAGACWNINMVSLQVLGNGGGISSFVSAISYASAYGIPILNFSGSYQPVLGYGATTIKKAIANYPGLMVCAAGNGGYDIGSSAYYPASFDLPNLISVGSISSGDVKSAFSNYSQSLVDLFAPGEDIYSTTIGSSYNGTGTYASGTSFAAPFVTGIAALIKSLRPDYSSKKIKDCILKNADSIDALAPYCKTGGKLNAYKAVLAATEQQTLSGDINGDGKGDVIVTGKNISGCRVFNTILGNANGSFSYQTMFTSTMPFSWWDRVYAGDFNGDSKTDVLVHMGDGGHHQFLIYLGTGNCFSEAAYLNSTRVYDSYNYPCRMLVNDINNDGKDDFVVSYQNSAGYRCFMVFKGKTTSPYLSDSPTNALNSGFEYIDDTEIFTGDFNGDGYGDVLAPNADALQKRVLLTYLGTASGTLSEAGSLTSTRNHKPETYPCTYHVADFDGDEKDDMAVTYGDNGVRKFLTYQGKSTSPFMIDATTNSLDTTDSYGSDDYVFPGDFDGDGKGDLLIHYANSSGLRTLRLHAGQSDYTYNSGVVTTTTEVHDESVYPCSLYVFDVQGDGRSDLVVKRKNGGKCNLYIYLGQANGTFASTIVVTTAFPFYN